MAFRRSIPQAELRAKLTPEERANGPVYQASRGGWFKAPTKPVPGTPKGKTTR
ncbi:MULTISPECIES: hypothetical protein [Streptomyces]|uniref:hypothetical protein n=1 Tax=Streptomyces TaxID=1883 RepID=UPI0016748D96|nr:MULTISPECIES: hypothetical protein [Streptomyces]MBK3524832.1 hypothetical protein [Streptomyces sp. MBT70]GGR71054.1 hypothetical protein GCM10010236_26670 [Streptomyces eurythermus]